MIKISQLKICHEKIKKEMDLEDELFVLKEEVAKQLHCNFEFIEDIIILKKSIDARKNPEIYYIYAVAVKLKQSENKFLSKKYHKINVVSYKKTDYELPLCHTTMLSQKRPLIVGSGPAGLFCAYLLASSGCKPVILERGSAVEERLDKVNEFFLTGKLDINTNVQFGEGGAGTFSDGKLNTLVKDKFLRNQFVLETFVACGAPEEILYEAKPHIGTDILVTVVHNLREKIKALGGEIYFQSQVTDILLNPEGSAVCGVKLKNDKEILSHTIILAIGHSARDTFDSLYHSNIQMMAKEFAVGFRVEHLQQFFNESQYGKAADDFLPASYKVTAPLNQQRGVYSFCMCPGGYVVNASSEQGYLAVNGMSNYRRDSLNANSAIVITVGLSDFKDQHALSGMNFQRSLEKKAFELGGGKIPQQLYGDFCEHRNSNSYGNFASETKGSHTFARLDQIFTEEMNQSFQKGMNAFSRQIKNFDCSDAILSGIESRTSSPVRILRNDLYEANISGLYPCGEGAGYAGGITSAAMDGMKVAEAVIARWNNIHVTGLRNQL